MTATELNDLLERVQAWPEEAQNKLVAVANQIESELQGDYVRTQEELRTSTQRLHLLMQANLLQTKRSQPPLRSFDLHEAGLFAASAGGYQRNRNSLFKECQPGDRTIHPKPLH